MIRQVRPTLVLVVLSFACRAQPRVDPGMTYHPGGTLKITFAQPIDPDRTKVQAVFTGSASPVQALAVDSDRKGAEFLVPAGARIGPVRVTVAGSDLGAVEVPIVRATGVGGALNVFFEQLNTSFATYLAALAALGVLTMSILQAIKNLFYVRRLFQQKRMLWWLKTHAKEVQNNFDIVLCPCELEKEIVRIAADGNRRAFYDAELDDFIKELTAAALLIIDYSRYEDKDRKLAYSQILAVFASNASRRDFEILTGALPAGVYPEFGGRDAQRPKNQRVKVFHKWARQFPHSTAPRKLDSAT